MYCLLEVVSVFPEKLAPRFADKVDWIKVSCVFMCLFTSCAAALGLYHWIQW